jgi:hypothetical protein
MYFDYFDEELIDSVNIVDVWKDVDIDEFIEDDNFEYHNLNEHENLMDLSFKYYDTIDNWWIIFLFNKFLDINFCMLQSKTIANTQDKYVYNLGNYNNIEKKEKDITKYIVRQFYLTSNTLEESIILTNSALNNISSTLIDNIKEYIYNTLILESTYKQQIKIPNQITTYKIMNYMEKRSIEWQTQNT